MEELQIFTGAYGFDIVIDTNLDLTNATAIKLRIKAPSGTVTTKSLSEVNVDTPVSAGIVRYTVAAGDFTSAGLYKLQVSDETGGTKKVTSSILKLRAKPSVEYTG
jgi:hypothetical protein